MWKLRPRRARDLPEIAQEDRAEADPKTLCVGSEVRLTPMWSSFLWSWGVGAG